MNDIDKAEYKQAINAFLIPSTLFISCLLGAAGTFLVREGYGLGWGFLAASLTIIIWAMFSFITFQNKLRAKGLMKDQFDSPAPEFDDASADSHPSTELGIASDSHKSEIESPTDAARHKLSSVQ